MQGFDLVRGPDMGYAPIMHLEWKILQPNLSLVQKLRDHLGCHPITAKVLANRNIKSLAEACDFFQPSLDILPSPMDLGGMQTATQRIQAALERQERILVFGDYDADGVTATALLVDFLTCAGAKVYAHIPHRVEEGYGLQPKHINQLAAPQRIDLIITVDCGSSSHEAVKAAKRFGIDVIITDHHNIDTPPDALAVINPKLPGEPNDLASLAGVGVAFYLAIGLRMVLRNNGWWRSHREPNLKVFSDLVALGTIADMVPLTGVNRVLVKTGLRQINASTRPGLDALRAACKIPQGSVGSEDIAFRLAPRINAAGRIAHADVAYDLLGAPTIDAGNELAEVLSQFNHRRQSIEQQIFDQIARRLESRKDLLDRKTLLLADPGWHQGVLGIVASKLTARYHRPVILMAIEDGIGKGSGRSIPGLNLFSALTRCSHLLEKFGGHQLAAGLTVRVENIRKLQAAFEEAVMQALPDQDAAPRLEIDSEIQFSQIDARLMNELKDLEPYGTDNPPPVFLARDVRVISAAMVGRRHRSMSLCQSVVDSPSIDAIHFNLPPDAPKPGCFERLAFRIQWNRYRGEKRIQLIVEDI
jgi:single-stranded-DNA-specific exonuclease